MEFIEGLGFESRVWHWCPWKKGF